MPLTTEDDSGTKNSFIGTGDYLECKARLEPLLNRSVSCSQDPCSFNGVHQPEIDFVTSHFYGFSEFWYTMEDVYRGGGPYKISVFEKLAKVRRLSLSVFLSLPRPTPTGLYVGQMFSLWICIYKGGYGGSIDRALASRSSGFHDQRFKSRPEHKKNL